MALKNVLSVGRRLLRLGPKNGSYNGAEFAATAVRKWLGHLVDVYAEHRAGQPVG